MPAKRCTFAVTVLCAAAVVVLVTAAPASAHPVLRGTTNSSVFNKGVENAPARLDFLAAKLRAQLLRVGLRWDLLEPQRGQFDQVYLDELATSFHAAAGDGLKIIVSLCGTPKWASDRTLWRYAPPGYAPGVYRSFYPPATARLGDLTAFVTKLSSTFDGDVLGYECRNEPNLWTSLYPQRTPSDSAFAARRYAAMLKAFSAGVRAGDPNALVIAGATAPTGANDRMRTSPQRFARLLKTMVDPSVFDAYSHHPYAVGGARNIAPEAMPRDPAHTVSLGNIATLLQIFPAKPFYLSEYGYYTQYNASFGICVNQVTQARFLKRAYRFAARFPQVQALIWYPYHDTPGARRPYGIGGVYSGLVTGSGVPKLSWYAFARGNKLTLEAPTEETQGASVRLSGSLTSETMGGLRGKKLVLYRRAPSHPWRVAGSPTTGVNGAWHVTVAVSGTTVFRVAWLGVVSSQTLVVSP